MQFNVPHITDLSAGGPATITIHTIRNADGTVAQGAAIFDVNYRFPGADTFTGLHIHNGKAGENGPVTINTGLIRPLTSSIPSISAVISSVSDPNMRTVAPGGLMTIFGSKTSRLPSISIRTAASSRSLIIPT
jgi:hypothetical protein